MSEKLFGRLYETVGSSSSDLLLKSKGSVKVQWGNKFIELIKDGNINYPRESIKKLIEETIIAKLEEENSKENSEETTELNLEDIKKELEEKILLEESSRIASDEDIKSKLTDCLSKIDKENNVSEIESNLKNLIVSERNRAVNEEKSLRETISNVETSLKYVNTQLEELDIDIVDTLNVEIERSTTEDAQIRIDFAEADIQIKTDITNAENRISGTISDLETAITVKINSTIPVNSIILYKGTTAPTGWVKCDGTNNTPDLADPIDGVMYIMKSK